MRVNIDKVRKLSESALKEAVCHFLISYDKAISLGHEAVPIIKGGLEKGEVAASEEEIWRAYERLTDEVVEKVFRRWRSRLAFKNN